jgi:hypothetical protein
MTWKALAAMPSQISPSRWLELYQSHKLKETTLSGSGGLRSGSKIKPEQFILSRALWLRLRDGSEFIAASGTQPKHWTKAQEAL